MSIDYLAGIQANQKSKPGVKAQKFNPYRFFKNVGDGALSGKQLTRGARALSALETRPTIKGYGEIANQLGREQKETTAGFGKLGERLQGGVSDVYKQIAESEAQNVANQSALGGMLNQKSGQIAGEGAQQLSAIQANQTGAQAAALQLRGSPGTPATAELAQAVAAQKAAQVANSGAAQQFASAQGAGSTQLASQMAGAAQLQGGGAQSEIAHTILGRDAAENQKFREGIQEAKSKQGEAKASRGETFVSDLLKLRGEDQKFKLGEQAVTSKKEELGLSKEENAQKQAQIQKENSQWAKEYGLKQYEAHHSPSETEKKAKEVHGEISETKTMLHNLLGTAGRPPKNEQEFSGLVGTLITKTSAKPKLVQKVAQKWWEEHRKAAVGHVHR